MLFGGGVGSGVPCLLLEEGEEADASAGGGAQTPSMLAHVRTRSSQVVDEGVEDGSVLKFFMFFAPNGIKTMDPSRDEKEASSKTAGRGGGVGRNDELTGEGLLARDRT